MSSLPTGLVSRFTQSRWNQAEKDVTNELDAVGVGVQQLQTLFSKRHSFFSFSDLQAISTLLYVLCRYGMVANVLYTLAIANKLPTEWSWN